MSFIVTERPCFAIFKPIFDELFLENFDSSRVVILALVNKSELSQLNSFILIQVKSEN